MLHIIIAIEYILLCSVFYLLICTLAPVRSPYVATSTPYLSKKPHHRFVNGTTGGLHHELDDTNNQVVAVNSNAKQRWAKAVTATGEDDL